MEEYEYSIKVESIDPIIEYCKSNNYILKSIMNQNRIVYENHYSKDIIARITTSIKDGEKHCVFDCKNIGTRNRALKISNESLPIEVTDENRKEIESILSTLNFYQSANNTRTRYVYMKDGVKFEIDDYITPIMVVVGIEGERAKVDKIYNELKKFDINK